MHAIRLRRQGKLNELTALVQPYIWIEGERPASVNTFDEVARNPEATGEHFLTLSNQNPPPAKYEKYGVYYDMDVPKEGIYNIYVFLSMWWRENDSSVVGCRLSLVSQF